MKTMYVGPTIAGVATRNTVYDEVPAGLRENASPFLLNLFVPLSDVRDAMEQINTKKGPIWTFYNKALEHQRN